MSWSEEMDAQLFLMRLDAREYLTFAIKKETGGVMAEIFRVNLDERVARVRDEGWDLVVQQDNFAVLDRVQPRRWFRPWHRYERMFLHATPTYLVERRWFTSRGRRVNS